jgi:hypothetical protein
MRRIDVTRFATLGLILVLTFTARASVVQSENGTLHKTLTWGAYTVTIWHYQNEHLADVAQIRSSSGHVWREIRGVGIFATSESLPLLKDFTGDGIPELRLIAWSGGAYCCYTDVVFDRAKGLKNILIYNANEYHLTKSMNTANEPARDLNRDKRSELILENDAISHINGSTHGATSVLVLGWNGGRYVDATRAFPRVARNRAIGYKQRILDRGCVANWSLECLDLATGFYAGFLLAGNELEARTWLTGHGAGNWILTTSSRVKRVLEVAKCRIGLSQKHLIYISTSITRGGNSGC